MKTTILFILLATSVFAQKIDTTKTPGFELIKASKHFYTGMAITGAGALITMMPINDPDQKKMMSFTGSGIALIGSIFVLESHIHIKRAGVLLNKNGIGLTYNLK